MIAQRRSQSHRCCWTLQQLCGGTTLGDRHAGEHRRRLDLLFALTGILMAQIVGVGAMRIFRLSWEAVMLLPFGGR